jgi:hypothetical protein
MKWFLELLSYDAYANWKDNRGVESNLVTSRLFGSEIASSCQRSATGLRDIVEKVSFAPFLSSLTILELRRSINDIFSGLLGEWG